jgi:hypothetical protein
VANIRYVSLSEVPTNLARRGISHRSRFGALICLRLGDAAVADQHEERSQTQKPARKKLISRADRDHSQSLRFTVQILFATLNVWIGVQFYLWVRWAESGGHTVEVSRPAGVEGWLPIEGLMQLKYFLVTGQVPHVHAAGFFLFSSFLVISLVFRKSFCSWMCPVGTVSEYLWKLGRSISGRSFQLPRWADIPLRSLKYLVLSFFASAVISMSAASIAEFLNSVGPGLWSGQSGKELVSAGPFLHPETERQAAEVGRCGSGVLLEHRSIAWPQVPCAEQWLTVGRA